MANVIRRWLGAGFLGFAGVCMAGLDWFGGLGANTGIFERRGREGYAKDAKGIQKNAKSSELDEGYLEIIGMNF
jgi:hypothetical protein